MKKKTKREDRKGKVTLKDLDVKKNPKGGAGWSLVQNKGG
jgi:hypothetical protein